MTKNLQHLKRLVFLGSALVLASTPTVCAADDQASARASLLDAIRAGTQLKKTIPLQSQPAAAQPKPAAARPQPSATPKFTAPRATLDMNSLFSNALTNNPNLQKLQNAQPMNSLASSTAWVDGPAPVFTAPLTSNSTSAQPITQTVINNSPANAPTTDYTSISLALDPQFAAYMSDRRATNKLADSTDSIGSDEDGLGQSTVYPAQTNQSNPNNNNQPTIPSAATTQKTAASSSSAAAKAPTTQPQVPASSSFSVANSAPKPSTPVANNTARPLTPPTTNNKQTTQPQVPTSSSSSVTSTGATRSVRSLGAGLVGKIMPLSAPSTPISSTPAPKPTTPAITPPITPPVTPPIQQSVTQQQSTPLPTSAMANLLQTKVPFLGANTNVVTTAPQTPSFVPFLTPPQTPTPPRKPIVLPPPPADALRNMSTTNLPTAYQPSNSFPLPMMPQTSSSSSSSSSSTTFPPFPTLLQQPSNSLPLPLWPSPTTSTTNFPTAPQVPASSSSSSVSTNPWAAQHYSLPTSVPFPTTPQVPASSSTQTFYPLPTYPQNFSSHSAAASPYGSYGSANSTNPAVQQQQHQQQQLIAQSQGSQYQQHQQWFAQQQEAQRQQQLEAQRQADQQLEAQRQAEQQLELQRLQAEQQKRLAQQQLEAQRQAERQKLWAQQQEDQRQQQLEAQRLKEEQDQKAAQPAPIVFNALANWVQHRVARLVQTGALTGTMVNQLKTVHFSEQSNMLYHLIFEGNPDVFYNRCIEATIQLQVRQAVLNNRLSRQDLYNLAWAPFNKQAAMLENILKRNATQQ